MNKEEERNYVFAQLNSLPNAFQYVSVTNYIENLEQENKELKEHIEKYEHYCKTTGIEELMQENKQLKDNWNKIEQIIENERMSHWTPSPLFLTELLSKMQELEKILKEVE